MGLVRVRVKVLCTSDGSVGAGEEAITLTLTLTLTEVELGTPPTELRGWRSDHLPPGGPLAWSTAQASITMP